MSNDLRVNAVELGRQPGTRRHIVRSIPLADVDIDDARLAGDVTVDVTLESTLDDIVVSGELSVDWSDECRRCLRPLADTLRVEVERAVRRTGRRSRDGRRPRHVPHRARPDRPRPDGSRGGPAGHP